MSITTSNSKKRKTSPDNVTPRSSKTKEKNSIGSSGCNTPSSQNSDTSSHESIISIWDESPNMENGLPIPEIEYCENGIYECKWNDEGTENFPCGIMERLYLDEEKKYLKKILLINDSTLEFMMEMGKLKLYGLGEQNG